MPIPVSCQCGQAFRAKDDLAGKKVKCPKCGQPIQIPGADASGSASASGLLSIDDLMKMDAAAPAGPQSMPGMGMPGKPAGMPGMQQGIPGMQQGIPGMQPGMPAGFPQAGGFQAPSPFFAQPGARPRSSGGNQGFKIAMLSLGGVGALAVIAIVLIFVFRRGSDNTNTVASTTPGPTTPGTTTPGTTGPGTTTPGTTTPGTSTPGTSTPGTSTPGTSTPGTPTPGEQFAHAGFDTPDAAYDGYIKAVQDKDTTTLRTIARDAMGPAWDELERAVENEAKQKNTSAEDAWKFLCEVTQAQLAAIVQRHPAQTETADRATIRLDVKDPINPQATQQKKYLFVRDAKGKWHLWLEEGERKLLADAFKAFGVGGPAISRGPTLAAGLKRYYAQQKDLRGSWLAEADDQPHMAWSWMTEVLPYIGHEELYGKLDFKKQWFTEANRKLGDTIIPQFLNPADNRRTIKEFSLYQGMAVSHFVGVSGIEDRRQVVAGALPRTDPRAGVFGYDRVAKPSEITDGTSNTIMVIGVEMPSPWIVGSGATIRGAREPYFGGVTGSQFGTRGQNGAITMMADGSVRLISSSIDPKLFRDLCTIHGGEKVDLGPYPLKEEFFGGTPAKTP